MKARHTILTLILCLTILTSNTLCPGSLIPVAPVALFGCAYYVVGAFTFLAHKLARHKEGLAACACAVTLTSGFGYAMFLLGMCCI